jgi:flagellar motor switch protein FliG
MDKTLVLVTKGTKEDILKVSIASFDTKPEAVNYCKWVEDLDSGYIIRTRIIEEYEDCDLTEILQAPFVFDDIILFTDREIQKILREVDSQELCMAIKGEDVEVQDKIFRNMSKRAVAMLKEDMEYMGPIRKVDHEFAQRKIMEIIDHLDDIGEIVKNKGEYIV